MELKYLYTMQKVVETGSYQAAAAALNYAPSTISFQIGELERELHITLFERRNGRMVLTQAGEERLPLVERILDSVEKLFVCGGEDTPRGTLTLALPESLATYVLQPVLRAFKEQAPQVRLSLRVMNCFAIQRQLATSDIDLALHYDVGGYRESIERLPLYTYPLTLVGSPLLTAEERDFTTPHQHKRVCHVQNDPNALYLKLLERYLRERDITLEGELEVWSIETVKRSVMSNLGVACLPRFAVEEELERGQLVELPTELDGHMQAICAYDRSRWPSPARELLLRLLREHFQLGT